MLFFFHPRRAAPYAKISGTRRAVIYSQSHRLQKTKEKVMHRKRTRCLAICLALFMCLFVTQALAKKLVLTNKTTKKVYVAVCYLDSTSNNWVVRGWYAVDALSKNVININTNNPKIYVHGKLGNINLRCNNRSASRTFAVVSDKFLYKQGKQRPQGNGLRNVSFCETKLNSSGSFGFSFND